MRQKKTFKYFSILDYEKEQDYLRYMHNSGWKFVKVSGFCVYHFEKCEPEDVIYQLDYNPEGLAHKDEYAQMFRDCGWEYMQDYVGYSYFRKPASRAQGNEEIFCDADSRLQMLERVFKGRIIFLLVLFLGLLVPQFIINLTGLHRYVLASVFGMLILLYLVIFILFVIKYVGYKNSTRK